MGALIGASPRGAIRFTVPSVRPQLEVKVRGQKETPALVCDTAIIDGDLLALVLVWRATLVVQGRVPDVRSIGVRLHGR